MNRLSADLADLFSAASELQGRITASLRDIGFGH
jgi:hypothetical protein